MQKNKVGVGERVRVREKNHQFCDSDGSFSPVGPALSLSRPLSLHRLRHLSVFFFDTPSNVILMWHYSV